jgi:hypothetical protein
MKGIAPDKVGFKVVRAFSGIPVKGLRPETNLTKCLPSGGAVIRLHRIPARPLIRAAISSAPALCGGDS